MITQKELKELLHYDPETGVFTWLPRCINKFKSDLGMKIWNAKHAMTQAGYLSAKRNGKCRYITISIANRPYQAHRLSWLYMNGEFPADQIDHINGNGLDNRFLNLRAVTCSENKKNMKIQKNNTSGCVGVRWHKCSSKWLAQVRAEGRQIHLGVFDDWFEAICARKSAENKFGFHINHGRR